MGVFAATASMDLPFRSLAASLSAWLSPVVALASDVMIALSRLFGDHETGKLHCPIARMERRGESKHQGEPV
jgi:hypothetical protein